jgi:hypothetical protein
MLDNDKEVQYRVLTLSNAQGSRLLFAYPYMRAINGMAIISPRNNCFRPVASGSLSYVLLGDGCRK